jgi:hypothetical protein
MWVWIVVHPSNESVGLWLLMWSAWQEFVTDVIWRKVRWAVGFLVRTIGFLLHKHLFWFVCIFCVCTFVFEQKFDGLFVSTRIRVFLRYAGVSLTLKRILVFLKHIVRSKFISVCWFCLWIPHVFRFSSVFAYGCWFLSCIPFITSFWKHTTPQLYFWNYEWDTIFLQPKGVQ